MRSLVIKFLLWCLKTLKYEHPKPPDLFALTLLKYRPIARKLAKLAEEKYPNSDESAKRHWVFIRMCTAFPKAEHRHLGLALELAVRDIKELDAN